jgi:hypothetical protein
LAEHYRVILFQDGEIGSTGLASFLLEDLRKRLLQYIKEVNQQPVVFRWRYGLELIST